MDPMISLELARARVNDLLAEADAYRRSLAAGPAARARPGRLSTLMRRRAGAHRAAPAAGCRTRPRQA